MQRVIKFRAWDEKKKEMRKVTAINWYDEFMWVDETPMSGDKLPIESTPLMQFTGLLDKNGKEIYEGDIVRYDNGLGNCKPELIEWALDAGCWVKGNGNWDDDGFTTDRAEKVKVIGNIYENKELLK